MVYIKPIFYCMWRGPLWLVNWVPLWSWGVNFVTFFVTNFAVFRKKLKALFTNN